ncbi:hypothetical protein FSP39_016454 [Pinctada imbricata]|uniref:Uncharacterized protein n=1 Tax=Pinctada imbricata TaxID=66713 RepID=A0AA88Y2U5_PINIB|nr:hypothetical protein FSP39_016454 [Pinctada imbricata]
MMISFNHVILNLDCGGIIDLVSGERRTITTPNYPSNYDVNAVCNWLIRAPTGMKVQMDMDDMQLSDNGQACYHWLEVRYNLMGQRGPEQGEVYTTTNDELPSHMMLKFNSIFASDRQPQKGFSLTVKAVGKGCSVEPCVLGICTDLADGAYSCACSSGISGTNCDTVSDQSLIVTSNFDGNQKDFFANANDDVFDWTHRSHSNFPFLSSNIPSTPAYGVFLSQLIRYARASTNYTDFVLRARRLSDKLLRQGYVCDRLTSSLRKFYGRYGELVIHYDVPLSRMVDDILS